jgi:hypothetical protein
MGESREHTMRKRNTRWRWGPQRQLRKVFTRVILATVMIAVGPCLQGYTRSAGAQVATPLHGVTIDNPWNTVPTVAALAGFSRYVTARVVFDEQESASDYDGVVQPLAAVANLMGEILDSAYVKDVSVDQFHSRADDYLDTWGNIVNIWEICNECNGEWLGRTSDVVDKMTYAYSAAKARGFTTALTLYYNQDCWSNPANEMFTWADANVPADMKQGLDYVLISYYEDDCNGLQPDWQPVFDRLAAMFPSSQIGFGEVGTHGNESESEKASYIQRYYGLRINNPQYIGGYFYWWFSEDMVPLTRYLWRALNEAW